MEWYRYNPETLEYEHPVTCQPNPARPGEFLIPPSATELEPPSTGDHEAAVFQPDSKRWTVKPDYRGTEYWLPDGSHHKIEQIGEVPPEDAIYEQPPDLQALFIGNGYARQLRIEREQQARVKQELLSYQKKVDELSRQIPIPS
ncbi:hypothetical protein [Endozoicomonas ascidiicola]|uniref:hypothetical protein n=1 Tax=Endozoicomonas ascidiicola TaxID=1698521 RepID=UPI00082B87F5|nr:hypothetical protein [Endozoicomonas ascidiicola]